jgi:hypothetical protein
VENNMPTYERTGSCCCGGTPGDCSAVEDAATNDPQILRITASTCDGFCVEGSFVQTLEYQMHLGSSFQWDVLPQFVTFGNGIPDGGHIDNCKYCEWVNGGGFTQQFFTGLQVTIACQTSGDHIGEWLFQVSIYRRGDDIRGNCDEIDDNFSATYNFYVTGITAVGGYLVGGPFLITLPSVTFPNFSNSSGNPADHTSSSCVLTFELGPP